MPEPPLYRADPAAWNALLVQGNATQPRKRVCADVILRDQAGRILLVDPSYKPGWDLPGGMVEADEAPDAAVRRELLEELGLAVNLDRLLCVDWVPAHGPWDDMLAFVFDGGTLDTTTAASLHPCDAEIDTIAFVEPNRVPEHLGGHTRRRVETAITLLGSGRTAYLVDGVM